MDDKLEGSQMSEGNIKHLMREEPGNFVTHEANTAKS